MATPTNGKLQRFEIRCASVDKFLTPILDTADSLKEAHEKLLFHHHASGINLNRLGIFDTSIGRWSEMPRTLSK